MHRDLKLENILLDKKMDTIKLTDFGLSSAAQPGQLMRTITGSAYYVAPEVLESSGYDGPASDVWSLGVVLYACVCGVLPFMGNGEEDLHTTLKDAKAGRFKIPRSMSPGMSLFSVLSLWYSLMHCHRVRRLDSKNVAALSN